MKHTLTLHFFQGPLRQRLAPRDDERDRQGLRDGHPLSLLRLLLRGLPNRHQERRRGIILVLGAII